MTWCVHGGDEHRYQTTFEDDEIWQGVCDLCGAEDWEDKVPNEAQEKGDQ